MNKIAIIGSGGAGKSTLSKELGDIFHLPVYHLDTYFWKPGWVQTPNDEWDEIVNNLTKKEKWIIDGNYSRTLDFRLKEADLIIFLDMPRPLTMYRIIKRRIIYHGKSRPDMNKGCQEKLDMEFIKWVWNFNKNKRPTLLERLKPYIEQQKVVILKSPKEVKFFLKDQRNKSKI